jgi:hypothetical protein
MKHLNLKDEVKQKESGRRMLLAAALAFCWIGSAQAQNGLDAGGLTFRDFAVADRGASFYRAPSIVLEGPGSATAKVLEIDSANGLARLHFNAVKMDVAVPLGWQAIEDQERGVASNADQSYRLIVWRLDFAFEGVGNAEQYAATKVGTIEARRPPTKAQVGKLSDGSYLVVYEHVPPSRGDREPRTVFDVVMPNPTNAKEGVLMTLGVPSSQADRGSKLLALLSQAMQIAW